MKPTFWNAVTAVMTTIIAASIVWIATTIMGLKTEIVRIQEWQLHVNQFIGIGNRYTQDDANHDIGIIAVRVNDHELRIRELEKN